MLGQDPRQPQIRAALGSMPQESVLSQALTVREAVQLFARSYPAPLKVDDALALADLHSVAGRRAGAAALVQSWPVPRWPRTPP
ncbi:MAG: hypothetical protein Q4C67_09905 [Deinococcus sp.]|nr:hypothetical protein [Deinococcus sp.]